jgi:hypothetical protein
MLVVLQHEVHSTQRHVLAVFKQQQVSETAQPHSLQAQPKTHQGSDGWRQNVGKPGQCQRVCNRDREQMGMHAIESARALATLVEQRSIPTFHTAATGCDAA